MMITAEMTLAPGYEDLGLMTGEGAELGHSNRGGRLYDQAGPLSHASERGFMGSSRV